MFEQRTHLFSNGAYCTELRTTCTGTEFGRNDVASPRNGETEHHLPTALLASNRRRCSFAAPTCTGTAIPKSGETWLPQEGGREHPPTDCFASGNKALLRRSTNVVGTSSLRQTRPAQCHTALCRVKALCVHHFSPWIRYSIGCGSTTPPVISTKHTHNSRGYPLLIVAISRKSGPKMCSVAYSRSVTKRRLGHLVL